MVGGQVLYPISNPCTQLVALHEFRTWHTTSQLRTDHDRFASEADMCATPMVLRAYCDPAISVGYLVPTAASCVGDTFN